MVAARGLTSGLHHHRVWIGALGGAVTDARLLVASSNTLEIIDENLHTSAVLEFTSSSIDAVAFCSISSRIAVATSSGLLIYEQLHGASDGSSSTPSPRIQWSLKHKVPLPENITTLGSLAWLHEGKVLMAGSKSLFFWHLSDQTKFELKSCIEVKHKIASILSLMQPVQSQQDTKAYFASTTADRSYIYVCRYNIETNALSSRKLLHRTPVLSMQWCPYSSRYRLIILATLSQSGLIRIWRDHAPPNVSISQKMTLLNPLDKSSSSRLSTRRSSTRSVHSTDTEFEEKSSHISFNKAAAKTPLVSPDLQGQGGGATRRGSHDSRGGGGGGGMNSAASLAAMMRRADLSMDLVLQFSPRQDAKCVGFSWCRFPEADDDRKVQGDDTFPSHKKDDLLWIVTTHADGVFGVWALENLAFRGQGAVRPILLQSLVSPPSSALFPFSIPEHYAPPGLHVPSMTSPRASMAMAAATPMFAAADSSTTSRAHLHRSKSLTTPRANPNSPVSVDNELPVATMDSPRSITSSSTRVRNLVARRKRTSILASSMIGSPFAEATSDFRPMTSAACFGYLMDANHSYARLPALKEPASASCGGSASLEPYRFEFYGFSSGELLQKWALQVASSEARVANLRHFPLYRALTHQSHASRPLIASRDTRGAVALWRVDDFPAREPDARKTAELLQFVNESSKLKFLKHAWSPDGRLLYGLTSTVERSSVEVFCERDTRWRPLKSFTLPNALVMPIDIQTAAFNSSNIATEPQAIDDKASKHEKVSFDEILANGELTQVTSKGKGPLLSASSSPSPALSNGSSLSSRRAVAGAMLPAPITVSDNNFYGQSSDDRSLTSVEKGDSLRRKEKKRVGNTREEKAPLAGAEKADSAPTSSRRGHRGCLSLMSIAGPQRVHVFLCDHFDPSVTKSRAASSSSSPPNRSSVDDLSNFVELGEILIDEVSALPNFPIDGEQITSHAMHTHHDRLSLLIGFSSGVIRKYEIPSLDELSNAVSNSSQPHVLQPPVFATAKPNVRTPSSRRKKGRTHSTANTNAPNGAPSPRNKAKSSRGRTQSRVHDEPTVLDLREHLGGASYASPEGVESIRFLSPTQFISTTKSAIYLWESGSSTDSFSLDLVVTPGGDGPMHAASSLGDGRIRLVSSSRDISSLRLHVPMSYELLQFTNDSGNHLDGRHNTRKWSRSWRDIDISQFVGERASDDPREKRLREEHTSDGRPWRDDHFRHDASISSLSFSSSGSLVVALSDCSTRIIEGSKLQALIGESLAVPAYHPAFLVEELKQAKFARVEQILGYVHWHMRHRRQLEGQRVAKLERIVTKGNAPLRVLQPIDVNQIPLVPLDALMKEDDVDQQPSKKGDDFFTRNGLDASNQAAQGDTSDDPPGFFDFGEREAKELVKMLREAFGDEDRKDDGAQNSANNNNQEKRPALKNGLLSDSRFDFGTKKSRESERRRKLLQLGSSRRFLPFLTRNDVEALVAVIESLDVIKRHQRALDVPGSKYMLGVLLHKAFQRGDRAPSIQSHDIAWAMHSQSQESLIDLCVPKSDVDWETLRDLGVGYFMHNTRQLTSLIEKMARDLFLRRKNPSDCMLWYMALKRKQILLGLFRAAEKQKMWEFLSNDFTKPKWKTAAVRNGQALQKKREFAVAAAFFILGDRFEDAVRLCCFQLKDFQMALVLCRLYYGDSSEFYDRVITQHMLPYVRKVESRDPWVEHIALWLLRKPKDAVLCLLASDMGTKKALCPELASFLDFLKQRKIQVADADEPVASGGVTASASAGTSGDPMASFNMDAFSSFGSFGMPQAVKPKPKAELLTATSPANYALCWEVVTNEAHAEVIRCSAFSYASSGMPILALELLAGVSPEGKLVVTDAKLSIESDKTAKSNGGQPPAPQSAASSVFDMGAFDSFGGFGSFGTPQPQPSVAEQKSPSPSPSDSSDDHVASLSDLKIDASSYFSFAQQCVDLLVSMRCLERARSTPSSDDDFATQNAFHQQNTLVRSSSSSKHSEKRSSNSSRGDPNASSSLLNDGGSIIHRCAPQVDASYLKSQLVIPFSADAVNTSVLTFCLSHSIFTQYLELSSILSKGKNIIQYLSHELDILTSLFDTHSSLSVPFSEDQINSLVAVIEVVESVRHHPTWKDATRPHCEEVRMLTQSILYVACFLICVSLPEYRCLAVLLGSSRDDPRETSEAVLQVIVEQTLRSKRRAALNVAYSAFYNDEADEEEEEVAIANPTQEALERLVASTFKLLMVQRFTFLFSEQHSEQKFPHVKNLAFDNLKSSLTRWLDRHRELVQDSFLDCIKRLSYTPRALDELLVPLSSPGFADENKRPDYNRLASILRAQSTCERFASQMRSYIENRMSAEPLAKLWHEPREIAKLVLPFGVAINHAQPSYVAIASSNGIREINVDSSLKFRARSPDKTVLLDTEHSTWEGALHRFDSQQQAEIDFRRPSVFERSGGSHIDAPQDGSDYTKFEAPYADISLSLPDHWGKGDVPPLVDRRQEASRVYQQLAETYRPGLTRRKLDDKNQNALTVASHPTMPLYVSGTSSGTIHLRHFSRPRPLMELVTYSPMLAAPSVPHNARSSSAAAPGPAGHAHRMARSASPSRVATPAHSRSSSPLTTLKRPGAPKKATSGQPQSLAQLSMMQAAASATPLHRSHSQTLAPKVTGGGPAKPQVSKEKLQQGSLGARVTRVHFNESGTKVAAAGDTGYMCLWALDRTDFNSMLMFGEPLTNEVLYPYQKLACHSRTMWDFVFIDDLVATAGDSTSHKNVCVWDPLMPTEESAVVVSYEVHEEYGGATAIGFLPNQRLLVSGGTKGEINILDYRQRQVVNTFQSGHSDRISQLAYVPNSNMFASVAEDGHLKIWDISLLEKSFFEVRGHLPRDGSQADERIFVDVLNVLELDQVSEKRTFFRTESRAGMLASFGVTDLVCSPCGDLYVSCAEGSVKYFKRK